MLIFNASSYMHFIFAAVNVTQHSASLGKDFNGELVTLYFASGEASVSTTFHIINHGEPEDNEDFIVSLRVLEGGPKNEITVTIDDKRPSIPQTNSGNYKHKHNSQDYRLHRTQHL